MGIVFQYLEVREKMPPCANCLSELKTTKRGEIPELHICDECFNFWNSPAEMIHDQEDDYPES